MTGRLHPAAWSRRGRGQTLDPAEGNFAPRRLGDQFGALRRAERFKPLNDPRQDGVRQFPQLEFEIAKGDAGGLLSKLDAAAGHLAKPIPFQRFAQQVLEIFHATERLQAGVKARRYRLARPLGFLANASLSPNMAASLDNGDHPAPRRGEHALRLRTISAKDDRSG